MEEASLEPEVIIPGQTNPDRDEEQGGGRL